MASFVVRTLNTFLGSLMWVDFTRFVGMQKSKYTVEHEHDNDPKPVQPSKGGKGDKSSKAAAKSSK